MPRKALKVSLGGDRPYYEAVADTSERWNGWLAAPYFTRAEVERIAADCSDDPHAFTLTIDAEGVWTYWPDYAPDYADPRGELYAWEPDGLVALGAHSWTWLEEE